VVEGCDDFIEEGKIELFVKVENTLHGGDKSRRLWRLEVGGRLGTDPLVAARM